MENKQTEKILLFDYDGVISDSTDDELKIYQSLQPKYNLPEITSREGFSVLFNTNIFQTIKAVGLTDEQIDSLISEWRVKRKSIEKPAIFAGIDTLLKEFYNKVTMYVVSSGMNSSIIRTNKIHGIEVFEDIYGIEKGIKKSDKIKHIKTLHPNAEFIMITDTKADVYEATECQVPCIGVTWGVHSKDDLTTAGAQIIADTIPKLQEEINTFLGQE